MLGFMIRFYGFKFTGYYQNTIILSNNEQNRVVDKLNSKPS